MEACGLHGGRVQLHPWMPRASTGYSNRCPPFKSSEISSFKAMQSFVRWSGSPRNSHQKRTSRCSGRAFIFLGHLTVLIISFIKATRSTGSMLRLYSGNGPRDRPVLAQGQQTNANKHSALPNLVSTASTLGSLKYSHVVDRQLDLAPAASSAGSADLTDAKALLSFIHQTSSIPKTPDSDEEHRLRDAEELPREAIKELQGRQGSRPDAAGSCPGGISVSHLPCHHAIDELCMANAISNLYQSSLLSYVVRVGIGILFRAFKLARR
ncbi:hypothetical protein Dsin_006661 [Dipteronia sinensis]|uniref:Uncharacterized protein n=1 Tax=Dipteronia sinensis TaxID=43782 RepID=A0AAE0B066_9ROSI|nr:hypothetical protein Dsin_006661 [Dipteronia sinensis]